MNFEGMYGETSRTVTLQKTVPGVSSVFVKKEPYIKRRLYIKEEPLTEEAENGQYAEQGVSSFMNTSIKEELNSEEEEGGGNEQFMKQYVVRHINTVKKEEVAEEETSEEHHLDVKFSPCHIWTDKTEDKTTTLDPNFAGYQLVGDSQMVRFGEQVLRLQRLQTPTKSGRIGICVSGQTISELHKRVRQKFYPIDKKIVLMIGTNDFLRNAEVSTMCHELSSLVKSLQESASHIVILTLPPVPKLSFREDHWTKLEKYNKHILSLDNGKNIIVGDISPLFYSASIKRCRLNLFELYFSGPTRRKDMIHLNYRGLQLIRNYILDYF